MNKEPNAESYEGIKDPKFAEEFLSAHNRKRKLHGAPPLSLSNELCEEAQQWAERIAKKRKTSCGICYCELAGIGENITHFPVDTTADEIVDYWYNENNKYEYEAPGWQAGTNYFTQIVWHSTTEVGVGKAKIQFENNRSPTNYYKVKNSSNDVAQQNSIEEQVVVAFYRPAGNNNRPGQFALNVNKPLKNNE
ncbi:cysteine-rich secretory protein family domain-containing protein [Ditylenchus destructor]|uniref:Cysteine-rich secretory protein family domain-containing protein n=1 Tax=Ditylenchus destructor TaxID=166010 RepID=A0AAD4R6D6_9BILA|nr:cysteine-rich secretory protein family domain-containing protein [Ditylenchus destructor]